MTPSKVKPIKDLVKGNLDIIDRQEQLIINHLRNEKLDKKEIVETIQTKYQKIKDTLISIYIYMEAIND